MGIQLRLIGPAWQVSPVMASGFGVQGLGQYRLGVFRRPNLSADLCARLPAVSDLCAELPAGDDSGAQIAFAGDVGAQKSQRGLVARRGRGPETRSGRRPGTGRGRFASLVMVMGALVAGSCARTGFTPETDPTFDASWIVESFELDGSEIDLATGLIVVDIDTSAAEVEVATGCRSLFGSFTFLDDGRAGITLPGFTKPKCNDDVEPWLIELDESFAAAIGETTGWSVEDDRLILDGPNSELVLVRSS